MFFPRGGAEVNVGCEFSQYGNWMEGIETVVAILWTGSQPPNSASD
jgi:hypothetical protein